MAADNNNESIELARTEFKVADLIGDKRIKVGVDLTFNLNGEIFDAGRLELELGDLPVPTDGEPGPSTTDTGTMTLGATNSSG